MSQITKVMEAMNKVVRLPSRTEVLPNDTWDLTDLFTTDHAWELAFQDFEKQIAGYGEFPGTLAKSADVLAACLDFDLKVNRLAEKLGSYAFLKSAEDQTDATYQRMMGRFQNTAMKAGEAASFLRPEILAIADETMSDFLQNPKLADHRLALDRLLRYKPHTLSLREEQMLAMQSEMAGSTNHIFEQLLDADLKFGLIANEKGEQIELSASNFTQFLQSPDREVRKKTFHQFYEQFSGHQHSLAAMLNGSVQKDVYYARVRNYPSALDQALFADDVPRTVYTQLIEAVRSQLPTLHRYYDLRRRKMGLPDIHHFDTYAPILADQQVNYTWDQAVDLVVSSLHPLGSDYTAALEKGLRGRWCDRYPNKGKHSGAFSAGGYDGPPYILMNYKPTVLNDVFTLAHEAGHSMHTCLSVRNQPYQYYHYSIFVAEVASTFNEQLLSHHLLGTAKDPRQRAAILNHEIDDIRNTVFRQTMFAEFEMLTHEMAEAGEPLTIDALRHVYGKLLADYFGPEFVVDPELSLECLRIPHFYRAFYVYKYATGMSAAIALSQKVLRGTTQDLQQYLGFLQGGCSKYPLELLRGAGVDLEKPEPVQKALEHFGHLVTELDQLI